MQNRLSPLRDRPKHANDVHVLVGLFVQAPGVGLAGDRDQRRPVHIGVGHAGDEVRCPGAEGPQAHAGLAREASVDVGHKRCPLLVPTDHEFDRGIEQGHHDVRILFARNAKNVVDAFVF